MDKLEQLLEASKENVMGHGLYLSGDFTAVGMRKQAGKRHKLLMWTAAVVGVLLISGFVWPALLYIGKKFDLLPSALSPREVRVPALQGYGQPVNQSVTSHGITLTIGNIYADPLRFEFDLVESFSKQAKSQPVITDRDITMNINGTENLYNFSGGQFEPADGNRYAGVVFMPMMNITPFRPLPEEFVLNVHVSQIGNVKGDWNFSVPVSQAKMAAATRVFQPNIEKTSGKITFKVNSVDVAPDQIIIQAAVTAPDRGKPVYPGPGGMFLDTGIGRILVTDGSGRSLSGQIVAAPLSAATGGKRVYDVTISATKLPNTAKQLNITPLRGEQKALGAPITGGFPITVTGPSGPVTITGVQFLWYKTVVHLVMNYSTYDGQPMQRFYLAYKEPTVTNFVPTDKVYAVNAAKHELVAEFRKLDPGRQYTFQMQAYTPLTGLSVSVPIK